MPLVVLPLLVGRAGADLRSDCDCWADFLSSLLLLLLLLLFLVIVDVGPRGDCIDERPVATGEAMDRGVGGDRDDGGGGGATIQPSLPLLVAPLL